MQKGSEYEARIHLNADARARKETRVAQEVWRAVWRAGRWIEAFINVVKLRHAFHLNAEAKTRKETRVAQEVWRAVWKGGEIEAFNNVVKLRHTSM